jgi:hypothetical protein
MTFSYYNFLTSQLKYRLNFGKFGENWKNEQIEEWV